MSEKTGAPGRWRDILTGRLAVYTVLLTLGVGMFAVEQFVVSTIMPTIVGDLGGVRYYSWTVALYAVGAIVGSAASGAGRDAFGDRACFVGAAAILTGGMVGAGLANDMLVLIGWRLLQGIAGGALSSQSYGLIAAVYPPHLRGRALGVISTTWGVATLLGPSFGGIFAEIGWWRGAFFGLVPFGLAAMALAWRYVPSSTGHGRISQMPYLRLLLLAGSIFAVSVTSRVDAPIERGLLLGGAFICLIIAFRQDARAERPMFPRQVAVIRTEIGAAYWILLIFSVVVAAVNVYSALFLQRLHGLSPAVAGYLYAIPSFIWTAGSIVVAPLHGLRQTIAIVTGLVMIAIGVAGVALTVTTGPVWLITLFMAILGLGVGAMNNPTIQRAIEAAPMNEKHIAGTSAQSMRTLGVSFGAASSGLIAAAAGLTSDDVPASVLGHAMHWVYGVALGFAVLNVIMAVPMLIGRKKRLDALAMTTAQT